jgi:ketosteroid isomerase-like protein
MSEENVGVVRSAWDVVVTEGIEAVLPYFVEDCVLEDFPELPDHAVYHGREGVREIDRHFREMWGEFTQEPVEFIDAGGDLVVGVIAMHGRGKGSGAPMASHAFWVHQVRDGRLAHMRAFTTRSEALKAAGLPE